MLCGYRQLKHTNHVNRGISFWRNFLTGLTWHATSVKVFNHSSICYSECGTTCFEAKTKPISQQLEHLELCISFNFQSILASFYIALLRHLIIISVEGGQRIAAIEEFMNDF